MNKTHWKKAFNKDFLGAHDLDENQELKLTIKNVVVKEIPNHSGQKEKRNVAYFQQEVKPMILNATACKIISGFANSHFIENWSGVKIQVYVMQGVKAFGEVTDALRIRESAPLSEDQITNIKSRLKEHDMDVFKFCQYLKVDSVDSIPPEAYNRCLSTIDAAAKKKAAQ